MITTLKLKELQNYVSQQINTLFPDQNNIEQKKVRRTFHTYIQISTVNFYTFYLTLYRIFHKIIYYAAKLSI